MDMLRSSSKSLGNHVVSPEEEKKGYAGKDSQKTKVLGLERKSEGSWNSTNNKYFTLFNSSCNIEC